MEALSEVKWDAVIVGTERQSALSKSNKKILHIDKNGYYASAEAAFNIADALKWTESVRNGLERPLFTNAEAAFVDVDGQQPRTSIATQSYHAYSLALAPQIIPNKSDLLQALVASHSENYVEFVAVGNSWILDHDMSGGRLCKVPNTREDLFSDALFNIREKRALTRFLRFLTNSEDGLAALEENPRQPFTEFLEEKFKLPLIAQSTVFTLLSTHFSPPEITVGWALPRLTTFIKSMNILGPGFAFVVPKWGGLSEVAQAGCRACAVSGGVYMLKTALERWSSVDDEFEIHLDQGLTIRTHHLVSDHSIQPSQPLDDLNMEKEISNNLHKAIYVVDAPLEGLFEASGNAQKASVAVIVCWISDDVASIDDIKTTAKKPDKTPVILFAHSSDTGECPMSQCVIYASTRGTLDRSSVRLKAAMTQLLNEACGDVDASVLFGLRYQQSIGLPSRSRPEPATTEENASDGRMFLFPCTVTEDPVFDDRVFNAVERAWKMIVGHDTDENFLTFRSA